MNREEGKIGVRQVQKAKTEKLDSLRKIVMKWNKKSVLMGRNFQKFNIKKMEVRKSVLTGWTVRKLVSIELTKIGIRLIE